MKRILVADDSATMRKILRQALLFAKVPPEAIIEAVDGADALKKIEEELPDLILSDLNMPVMDGFELMRILDERGIAEKVPVVIISSRGNAKEILRLAKYGVRKVIRKPFDVTSLFQHLAPFMGGLIPDGPALNDRSDDAVAWSSMKDFDVILGSALEKVLDMSFLAAELVPVASQSNEIFFFADIPVNSGPFSQLSIRSSRKTSAVLVSNFTGNDPEDDDLARADAISELANILVGELVTGYQSDSGEPLSFATPTCGVMMPQVSAKGTQYVFRLDDDAGEILIQVK